MKPKKLSAYLVFIGAFVTRVLLVVLMQNGGIFLLTFQREFNVGAALAGCLGSLPIATRGFIGLPAGAALRRWSCRKVGIVGAILLPTGVLLSIFASSIEHLVITFAVVTGIGGGMLWLTTVVVVERHFTEHFALAHSFVSSGSNIGKMILPPFIQLLISSYGWRGALLIEGAILFHCVAAASVFRAQTEERTSGKEGDELETCADDSNKSVQEYCASPSPSLFNDVKDDKQSESGDAKGCYMQIPNASPQQDKSSPNSKNLSRHCLSHLQWLPTLPVLIISLIYLFQSFGFVSISVHSVAKAEESGANSLQASYLLSLMGVGGALGRILNGIIVDRGWLSPIGINITMTVFICVMTFIGSIIEGYIMGLVLTGCLGFAFAFLFTVMPVLLKQMDGTERFSVNLGFVWAVGALGDIGGGFLTGLVRDITGSYGIAFYLAGAAFVIALILSIVLSLLDRRKSDTKEVLPEKV